MRSPFPGRPGFVLTEILAACILIGLLAGTVCFTGSSAGRGSPEKEAKLLARWLTDAVTAANRSGRSFRLICPANEALSTVTLEWNNPFKKETYSSLYGCRFLRLRGISPQSDYSPQWNTLTPGISIRVSRDKAFHYTIVSGFGRIRTAPLPAPAGDE